MINRDDSALIAQEQRNRPRQGIAPKEPRAAAKPQAAAVKGSAKAPSKAAQSKR